MKKGVVYLWVVAAALASTFAGRTSAQGASSAKPRTGAVFVMNNSADRNEVVSFVRATDGSLEQGRSFRTGGRGSGGTADPLASQGALTLSQDRGWLFAVNAGSGEISVFRVIGADLVLSDRVSSGGSEPVAVAQHGSLVYALNAGGTSNVVGFRFQHGKLEPIPDSIRFLSTGESGASSLSFSPDGQFLLVTERLTNRIDSFLVQNDGTLSAIHVNPSAGPGVFALAFAPGGAALASETGPAGVPDGSAISSYAVLADGALATVSSSVPTLGAANCWNAITPDGKYVYTGNSASSNISGFAIGAGGVLTALPGTVVGSLPAGATNIDMAITADGKFLYTLNTGNGTVGMFAIQQDGTLQNLGSADGLQAKAGFQGIAAN